jgi:hypothetical protein
VCIICLSDFGSRAQEGYNARGRGGCLARTAVEMLLLSTRPSLLQKHRYLSSPLSSWYVAEHRGLYAMRDACSGEKETCLPCLRAPMYRWGHQGGVARVPDCGACCPVGTIPVRKFKQPCSRRAGSDACRQKDAACGCQEFQSAGHCVHTYHLRHAHTAHVAEHAPTNPFLCYTH